jgi:signal transduction histidine kinase
VRPEQGRPRAAPDDPELDGIVRLATHICGAPAFVSLGPGSPSGQAIARSWALRGTDGEVRGWLTVGGAMVDLWQRDALDLVAAQAGALLERREREGKLLDTVGELLRSNDELTAFAGRVAHDLRAPLTAVHGFLSLADGPFRGDTSERAAECVTSALGAANRMRTLIDDLLGYARLDTRPALGAVDVPALVMAVRADLADEITAAAASVTYTGPETVTTDATLLRQLVQNLVANSLKHARDGVAPVVRVRAGVEQASWWIEVADNGPGIPAENRERVFDPFVRLTGAQGSNTTLGAGIGLATCARIAESLGGRITVDDADGGGAAFRVTVPPA